jgi:hypothetical protein
MPSGAPRRPKWLLTTPDGDLLVHRAALSVPSSRVERTIVVFLREVEERYGASYAVKCAFGETVECLILDAPTSGPAATVREAIARANVTGPLCVKDSDSFFSLVDDLPEDSFVAVVDARGMASLSRPGHKSYVRLNEQEAVLDIVEKSIVSNLISAGLYGFGDTADFLEDYDAMNTGAVAGGGMFVSHVVAANLLRDRVFWPTRVKDFVDIEISDDWANFRARQPTILCDIDGVVFRNQSLYFPPFWGDAEEPIEDNVNHLLTLQARGAQLVFVTSRPERFRTVTSSALQRLGLRAHALVMDCHHGTRYLVNDYAASNPYPSAVAVNVRRNEADLRTVFTEGVGRLDQEL